MIGRAAAEPLPEPIVARLREPVEQVSQAAQRFLRTCADALRARRIRLCLAQSTKRSQNLSRLSRSYDVRVRREHYPQRTSAACTLCDLPLSNYVRISRIFVIASPNAPALTERLETGMKSILLDAPQRFCFFIGCVQLLQFLVRQFLKRNIKTLVYSIRMACLDQPTIRRFDQFHFSGFRDL